MTECWKNVLVVLESRGIFISKRVGTMNLCTLPTVLLIVMGKLSRLVGLLTETSNLTVTLSSMSYYSTVGHKKTHQNVFRHNFRKTGRILNKFGRLLPK